MWEKQKYNLRNKKFLYFTCLYNCIIDSSYLIKYKAKQKHLLPFYATNNELKEIYIKNCTCYYFDDIITRDIDINISDMLSDENLYKAYEDIFIYDISYTCIQNFYGLNNIAY